MGCTWFSAPPQLVIGNPVVGNRAWLGAHEVYNPHSVSLAFLPSVKRGVAKIQCGEKVEWKSR